MEELESKLKKALEDVEDTYDDFVRGMLLFTRDSKEKQEKILAYIEADKSVTTSDVIEYLDELEGIA